MAGDDRCTPQGSAPIDAAAVHHVDDGHLRHLFPGAASGKNCLKSASAWAPCWSRSPAISLLAANSSSVAPTSIMAAPGGYKKNDTPPIGAPAERGQQTPSVAFLSQAICTRTLERALVNRQQGVWFAISFREQLIGLFAVAELSRFVIKVQATRSQVRNFSEVNERAGMMCKFSAGVGC